MVVANQGQMINENSPMMIGGVTLSGVTKVSESGGMYAPERTTEKGFPYASYIGPEAREVSADVTLHPPNRRALSQLRTRKRPFPVMIGFVSIRKCKLTNLSIDQEASIKSHYSATVEVKQIKEVNTGSADLVVVDNRDSQGNGSKKTQSGSSPSIVRNQASGSKNASGGDGAPNGEQAINGKATGPTA